MFDPAKGVRYLRVVALRQLITPIRNNLLAVIALAMMASGCKTAPRNPAPIDRNHSVSHPPISRSFGASSMAAPPLPPMPPGMMRAQSVPQSQTFDVPAPTVGPGLTLFRQDQFIAISTGQIFGTNRLQRSRNLIDWETIYEGEAPILFVDFEPPPACFYRLNY